ncbi:hypothetical protein B2G71_14135 [Novosphingobium sp. PC22D]|uniref:TonB C-terminal domain-containing protein n=1 Tax=Novosphingobium sp. PC22D TaxID=1962403 RepID=UPI000BF0ECBA|nr:TonB C-terminal domain-containing protein [Novosphingobium sp. PC22D]PEQ11921.1 hypothetical protein B2G71_14135 [Novosphingobium sp. PC22D]
MAALALRKEERLGLGIAIAAHVGVLGMLLLRPDGGHVVTPPERIEVTISDDIGLTSTSPDPYAQAAPDIAPVLGEAAPLAVPDMTEPLPLPPEPVAQPERPAPAPVPDERPRRRPEASRSAPSRPEPRPAPPKRSAPAKSALKADPKPAAKSGGSRVGSDFLEGIAGSEGSSRSSPAAEIGPRVQASLASAITRQLKPHWQAPQGADADQLVTIVRFRLNRDGSLSGNPTIVRQTGVTPTNEAQKERHAEQAIRAVRLAAPFNLPEEFYEGWKTVTSQFDRRLSQ